MPVSPQILTAVELIKFWKEQNLPSDKTYPRQVASRLFYLIEEKNIKYSDIKKAIVNYGKSEWHRKNNRHCRLYPFLDMKYMDKWIDPDYYHVPYKKYNPEMFHTLNSIISQINK